MIAVSAALSHVSALCCGRCFVVLPKPGGKPGARSLSGCFSHRDEGTEPVLSAPEQAPGSYRYVNLVAWDGTCNATESTSHQHTYLTCLHHSGDGRVWLP